MATALFLEVHSVIKCINAYTIIFAILNYMDSFLISAVIIPLVGSGMVLGGLLSISILQLPTIRRNMRREAVEQIYARIMEARMRLENTETFTNMAKESSIFAVSRLFTKFTTRSEKGTGLGLYICKR